MQPLASIEALDDPIYEAFYGLTEQPFSISTDPKFLFMSASHQRAYEELVTGLRRREGILLLTGETGTGKTTMCRAVLNALGDRTFSALILNPYMSGAEMLRAILRDFGFVSRDDLRRGAFAQADVPQLVDALEGFLATLRAIDSHAVVVIDEAQSLPSEVLDQIRLLTAHEREGHRLIQVLLVGQPLLLETLKTEPMYALNERVTRRVTLSPLPPPEVEAYIKHRLGVAGGSALTFTPDAAGLVAELSRGLPRRVNVLCDRALQEGRIEGAATITPEMVKHAARSLVSALETDVAAPERQVDAPAEADAGAILNTYWKSREFRWRRRALAGLAALLVVGALGYGYYAHDLVTSPPDVPTKPPVPRFHIIRLAVAVPVPSEEEIAAAIDDFGKGSGQLPDNRHDLH
ncbi:MAG TPA: AAA family ATPase [Vicinamibacterales bacterium]|nr:AAA family ATPase [Vicinamibacterales bacterium]